MTNWKEYLSSLYFNPKLPSSYLGPEKLYQLVKSQAKFNIGRHRIRKWLQDQEAYSLTRCARRKYIIGQPAITGEPTMIERSTMSIMIVKTVIMIVQIHNGARREEERVRRREEGGYSEGTGRIQWGYSESTVGYIEDTVRVHWGTVRVQLGYSGIRREEKRVRRRREGGYIEGTGRI